MVKVCVYAALLVFLGPFIGILLIFFIFVQCRHEYVFLVSGLAIFDSNNCLINISV